LLAAPAARADPIGFGYNFLTPPAVTGDDGNLGAVSFATTAGGQASGHAVLTAASLAVVTAAPLTNPDTFSGQAYDLTLQLTDGPSGKSGALTFTGKLMGSLTPLDAKVTTSFDVPTKTLVLGNDKFTVTVGPLVEPAGNNPTVVGTLMATVDAQAAGGPVTPTAQAPEPPALALAGFGVAAAAAFRARLRPRRSQD
jgi:hypothetical protein